MRPSSGAEPRYGAFYGEAVRPMIVADLFCSGTESDLLSCERNVFGVTHCQEYEAAGIKCLGMSTPDQTYVIPTSHMMFKLTIEIYRN